MHHLRFLVLCLLAISIVTAFDWTPASQIPEGYSVIRFNRSLFHEDPLQEFGGENEAQQKLWNHTAQFEIIGKFEKTGASSDYIFGKFNLSNATVRWSVDNYYADTLIVYKRDPNSFGYIDEIKKTCVGSQRTSSEGILPLEELKYYYTGGSLADFYHANWGNIIRAPSNKHGFIYIQFREPSLYHNSGNFYEFLPWFHDGNFLIPVNFSQSLVGYDENNEVMADPGCSFTSLNFPNSDKLGFLQYQIPIEEDFNGVQPTRITGSKNYYNLGFKPYSGNDWEAFSKATKPVEVNTNEILSPPEEEPSWHFEWDLKFDWATTQPVCTSSGNSCTSNSDCCSKQCKFDTSCFVGGTGGEECPGICTDDIPLCDPSTENCAQNDTPGGNECQGQGSYCASNSECCFGLVCNYNEGQTCQQSTCATGGMTCISDSGCCSGYSCISGSCEYKYPSCALNQESCGQCCTGLTCSNNICECDPTLYLSSILPDSLSSGSYISLPANGCDYEVIVTPPCENCDPTTMPPQEVYEVPSSGENRVPISLQGSYRFTIRDKITGVSLANSSIISKNQFQNDLMVLFNEAPKCCIAIFILIAILTFLYLHFRQKSKPIA